METSRRSSTRTLILAGSTWSRMQCFLPWFCHLLEHDFECQALLLINDLISDREKKKRSLSVISDLRLNPSPDAVFFSIRWFQSLRYQNSPYLLCLASVQNFFAHSSGRDSFVNNNLHIVDNKGIENDTINSWIKCSFEKKSDKWTRDEKARRRW